jgi:hypothetical protein
VLRSLFTRYIKTKRTTAGHVLTCACWGTLEKQSSGRRSRAGQRGRGRSIRRRTAGRRRELPVRTYARGVGRRQNDAARTVAGVRSAARAIVAPQSTPRPHHRTGALRHSARPRSAIVLRRVWFGFFLTNLSEKLAVGKSWLLGKAGGQNLCVWFASCAEKLFVRIYVFG